MTIGFVDWGIGGLSVYRELKRVQPYINCVYLSDSGSTPYGKMTKPQLTLRLHAISNYFRKQGITTIVIACNAASTVLDAVKLKNPDIKYFGMLDSGAGIIKQSKLKKCLVLGGKRTIRSKYFQNYFKDSKFQIQAKAAQPLSAFIESGDMASKKFNSSLDQILSNLNFNPESILLACTHYPAIETQIQSRVPKAKILDPAEFLVTNLVSQIKFSKKKGTTQFFTTGNPVKMKSSGQKAFALRIHSAKKIKI